MPNEAHNEKNALSQRYVGERLPIRCHAVVIGLCGEVTPGGLFSVTASDVSSDILFDDNAQVYLMEAGLELWLAMLRHATAYDEPLHELFPRIPDMLAEDLDHVKQVRSSSSIADV